jgi:uncharacterized membrane protein
MSNTAFLKPGQRVYLKQKAVNDPNEIEHTEVQTFSFIITEAVSTRLSVQSTHSPISDFIASFRTGDQYTMLTEAFGLGVRCEVQIELAPKSNELRLRILDSPTVFQNRQANRIEMMVSASVIQQSLTYSDAVTQWRKTCQKIGLASRKITVSNAIEYKAVLSADGLRLSLENAVAVGKIVMIIFKTSSSNLPYCVLSEVIWSKVIDHEKHWETGFRFIQIYDIEHQRLENEINYLLSVSV